MKTDSQMHSDVMAELKWEPSIREAEIGVAARDGVVTLTGHVESYAEKYAAARAAERVSGVRPVADDLKVKLPNSRERSDTEVAHAVVNALKWDIQVPADRIKAEVDNGWVMLEGDVEWQYQREAAAGAVRYLTGVKGVTNSITVKPKQASPFEVSQKIKDALRRNAELDSGRITVEAHDGRVTLRGTARSYAERMDAQRAAWAAPGVTNVDDRIAISL